MVAQLDNVRFGVNREAFRFFHEQAACLVGRQAEYAHELAKAEEFARLMAWHTDWYPDADADWSWMDERERNKDHEVWGAVLRDANGNELASLWGIFDPSREYERVIEAELADEAITERTFIAYDVDAAEAA